MIARRNRHVAAVALANKNARVIWALLAHGDCYQAFYPLVAAVRTAVAPVLVRMEFLQGVYLFGNRELGWFKIGQSSNIGHRYNELVALMPFPLEKINWHACTNPLWVERQLHAHFEPKRMHGEWFALNVFDVAQWQKVARDFAAIPKPDAGVLGNARRAQMRGASLGEAAKAYGKRLAASRRAARSSRSVL